MTNNRKRSRTSADEGKIISPSSVKLGRPANTLKQSNPEAHDLMVACLASYDTVTATFGVLKQDTSDDAYKFAAKDVCKKSAKTVRDTMHKYIVNVRADRESYASKESASIDAAKRKAKLNNEQKQYCLSYRGYDRNQLLQTKDFLLIAQSEVNFLLRTSTVANPIIHKESMICSAMDEINDEDEKKSFKLSTGYSQPLDDDNNGVFDDDDDDDDDSEDAGDAAADDDTINEY